MNTIPTIGDMVQFVLENRKGNAFKGYTEEAIAAGILRAIQSNTMLYACDDKGKICGVALGHHQVDKQTMFVNDILATERWVFPLFVQEFSKRWPTLTLAGLRHSILRIYNTPRLINKFTT